MASLKDVPLKQSEAKCLIQCILQPLARRLTGAFEYHSEPKSTPLSRKAVNDLEAWFLRPDGVVMRHRQEQAANKRRQTAWRAVLMTETMIATLVKMVAMAEHWVVLSTTGPESPVRHLLKVVVQPSGRPVFTVLDAMNRVTRLYWNPAKKQFAQLATAASPGSRPRLLHTTAVASKRYETRETRPLTLRELVRAALAKQLADGTRPWESNVLAHLFQHTLALPETESDTRLEAFETAELEANRIRLAKTRKPKSNTNDNANNATNDNGDADHVIVLV